MFQYRKALANVGADPDKEAVAGFLLGQRRIEAAGFVYFLTFEWNLHLEYEIIYNPKPIDFVSSATVERATEFLRRQGGCFSVYDLKLQWARILARCTKESEKAELRVETKGETAPPPPQSKSRKPSNKQKMSLVRDFIQRGYNAYAVLESSDADDTGKIRANYRRIVLFLHPDKVTNPYSVSCQGAEYCSRFNVDISDEESRKYLFQAVQDAFAILSDPATRHEYDCSLPFDETIPTSAQAKSSDFFQLFGPVFAANAKWSRSKPVPLLGDLNSTDAQLDEFYDFWRLFDTTRTFGHAAPHLLDEAESREEKRWMERENLKVQKKLVKRELARIQALVDLAYTFDPRIKQRQLKQKLELEERQQREQEAKMQRQRQQEQEAQRKQQQLEEEQERIKCERQIIKKLRQHVRFVAGKLPDAESLASDLERLSELSFDVMKGACEEIYKIVGNEHLVTKSQATVTFVKWMDSHIKQTNLENLIQIDRIVKDLVNKLHEDKGGSNGASVQGANTSRGGANKIVNSQGSNVKRSDNTDDADLVIDPLWNANELAALSRATDMYSAGVASRWNLVSKFVKTKTTAQCIQMAKDMANGLVPKPLPETFDASITSWTDEQQKAFEAALVRYPASLDPGIRWKNVAAAVEGKNPRECIQRFKMIKAAIMASGQR